MQKVQNSLQPSMTVTIPRVVLFAKDRVEVVLGLGVESRQDRTFALLHRSHRFADPCGLTRAEDKSDGRWIA